MTLSIEHRVARQAAMSAGDLLKQKFGRVRRITHKGAIDLVTEADIEAEKQILETLRENFPGDTILSEEKGLETISSERKWIVDPLDGTTNYAHGFPFFAVSIALEIQDRLVMGIVYNPFLNEFFEAVKRRGAFLNQKPIRVSSARRLEESLLCTGFPYDIRERSDRIFKLFKNMVTRARGIRRAGSAALDLCYVAAGRLDGHWEENLKPWDTAAGAIILTEAGGKVSTFEGMPFTPYADSMVACTPEIHEEMIQTLAGGSLL